MPLLYEVLERADANRGCSYDILMCLSCTKTILRCNFSRHKLNPKHLRKSNTPIKTQ